MNMEGPHHSAPQEPSYEQKQNEFRKAAERQIEEYALGLDPEIKVSVNPLEISSDRFGYGLRFVFQYDGKEKGFTDQEVSEKTLPAVEKALEEFYLATKKSKA